MNKRQSLLPRPVQSKPVQAGRQRTQKSSSDFISGLSAWLPITTVLLLATVLFTFRLESEGLWLDELTSLQDSSLNPIEAYFENQLRPLYYFLLMGWMKLGSSDAWLRGLAVIFALGSVFLVYRLGRRLIGEPEGIIAALMLALSPLIINHAQEIRMYTLSLCMSLAGTVFLADALLVERPNKPSNRTLAGWSLFRLLAILTVPLNVTLLMADAIVILARFRRERSVLVSFGKWFGLLVLLWSPSISSVIQESSPSGNFASHHSSAVPPPADVLVRQLKFWTVWPFAVQDNAIVAKFYKVFTLLLAGLLGASLLRKHKSQNLLWVLAWFVVPLIPIIVFSYLTLPVWQSRYVLFVSPYLFILLAAGITRLWHQWKISAVVISLAYLMAVGGGLVHHYTVQERPDYKFNIATIEQYEQPGDAVIWSYFYTKALGHYYDGSSEVYARDLRDLKTDADAQAWVSQFPTQYDRWWLVLDSGNPASDSVESAVAQAYNIEQVYTYEQGSKVLLLTDSQ